ncbi:bleomycin resistance protein [Actinomadura litoris]|uniref:bleomycin resistance protein n=1 Tax=Actinomadura litoris TaxID=2678616 RepID=UPI001FA7BD3E|nr:VOC family protein [Actinomadura litoris]
MPVLPSRDLAETLEFYARLGFETRGSWPDAGYLIVARGTVTLHFWHHPEVDPLATAGACYVYVDDADALHREWDGIGVPGEEATGSRLAPPRDTDYGMREFALVDRSGNLLRVGSSAPAGPRG